MANSVLYPLQRKFHYLCIILHKEFPEGDLFIGGNHSNRFPASNTLTPLAH